MQITLIGKDTGYSKERLEEEAHKASVQFTAVPLKSVVFSVQNNSFSLFDTNNKSLMRRDCYLFRGIGEADQEVMVMAKYLLKHGATVIEEIASGGALSMDKLFLGAISHHVPTPDYFMVQSEDSLRALQSILDYPLVMKATIGSMGRAVRLIQNEDELKKGFVEIGPRVILQKYYPVDHDYRAMVIGGKYVGAYRRDREDGDFRMNRPGNNKEEAHLPEDVIHLCERAAQSQNIEIAGIDLINYKDRWYVLEINTSPAFHQFEIVTGTNIAKEIIEYAISKIKKGTLS